MQLSGHQKGIWDMQFSPAERQLVSVSGDKLLKVWNIAPEETGNRCIATLQGHQEQLVKVNWINMGL